MGTVTFPDVKVRELSVHFVSVRVDIDEDADTADRLHVHGIPDTRVLSAEGQEIAVQVGFMRAAQFVEFLESALDASRNPQAEPEELEPRRPGR